MELEHSFTVPVPKDRAWDVLLDVERVAPCMPGATIDSVDGDEIHARIKVKVGPINMTYAGTARFVEKDKAAGVVRLEASGKETRGAGTASASVRSMLTDGGDETHVTVLTTLNVTGKPAQFGRGVMNEVGGRLLTIFAANLDAALAEPGGAADAAEGPKIAGTPGSAAGIAATPAGAAGSETTAAPAGTPGAAAVTGPAADDGTSVDELGLPSRAAASLRRAGVKTLGELAARTEDELLAIDGIGPASVQDIRTMLGKRGLALGRPLSGAGTPLAASNGSSGSPGAESGSADAGAAGTGTAAATGAAAASVDAAIGAAAENGGPTGHHPTTARAAAAQLEDDALNLLKVAGLPILKRALPVLAGLAAVGLLAMRARYRWRHRHD